MDEIFILPGFLQSSSCLESIMNCMSYDSLALGAQNKIFVNCVSRVSVFRSFSLSFPSTSSLVRARFWLGTITYFLFMSRFSVYVQYY